ncbi:MAG TPA: hypothetical protein VLF41_02910 [Candidatus Nanoarchaeia archaeon]|nr:hypothetical protein [Candidatus Nanoarchaeia archaeon]
MSKLRKIVFIVVVILIAVGVLLFIRASRPSKGSLTTGESVDTPAPVIAPKQLDGKYFSLRYPGRYDFIVGKDKPPPSRLETELLVATANLNSDRLTVTLDSTSKLEDDVSYYYRHSNHQLYKEETATIDQTPGVVMTRLEGNYERTAFVWRNGRLLVIALTSQTVNPSFYDAEFSLVSSSFKWR